MSIVGDQVEDSDKEEEDVKNTPPTQDHLHHDHQNYHIHSIKSTVVIRQLPSQGLSFQLWPAAHTLVSLLDQHRPTTTTPFSALLNKHTQPSRRLRILELGSGTGLVGIASAAILGADVTVSDLSHVLPNLKFNAEANSNTVGVNGGSVNVAALGWGEKSEMEAIGGDDEYDIIMGSDVVYHDHLYEPLLETLRFFLLGGERKWKNKKSVVFVMGHLKRWKKESVFFKKAKKYFDIEVLHKDAPCNGSRVGVLVYSFVGKGKMMIISK